MNRTAQAEYQSVHGAPCVPTVSLWTGRALSTLLVLFLLLDAVMKFVKPAPVLQACVQLGLPLNLVSTIGASLLVCSVLYAIPRTSILGAILLTGYFGGAVLSNLRVGNPLFTNTLFPVYFGALTWLGLYLRDVRLQVLVTLRRQAAHGGCL
jgi:DoxX-like family